MSIMSDTEYVLDETYYIFSDQRLTKAYLKHILNNSNGFDEALRKIRAVQDRVISLSNYAQTGLERLNDYDDDIDFTSQKNDFYEPNFTLLDKFYSQNSSNDYENYLKNEAPAEQLLSTIRQCEAIRVTSENLIKRAKSFYFFRNLQSVKMANQIPKEPQISKSETSLSIARQIKTGK